MFLSNIKIIPLGGVRENGKNMYIAEVEDDIYVLDCGLKYPENELLGIDTVIPDFTYFDPRTCGCHWGVTLLFGKS